MTERMTGRMTTRRQLERGPSPSVVQAVCSWPVEDQEKQWQGKGGHCPKREWGLVISHINRNGILIFFVAGFSSCIFSSSLIPLSYFFLLFYFISKIQKWSLLRTSSRVPSVSTLEQPTRQSLFSLYASSTWNFNIPPLLSAVLVYGKTTVSKSLPTTVCISLCL